ncbi:MAG: LEA type 2 family protein [Desulfobulbus sp.]|jgi:LEA14-like dessication related protein|nr:LEA type 2 family protein [Desulfobulbus sp.]
MHLSRTYSKAALCVTLCCALALLGGCAAMHALKESPRVTVADVRVRDIKTMETILVLELRIQNPNDVAIELYGINCEMEVDGRHFASGIADANQTIVPPFGTTTVPVSVYASVFDMVSSVLDLIQTSENASSRGKPVTYLIKGTVNAGVHGFKKEFPFTSSGELSLKGIGRTLNQRQR